MTDKVNPSINRPAEAFATAGAIAYGGNPEGYVIPANETTEISTQDSGINENALNAFDESSSSGSLQVTIDPGEAFVFGAWLAIDTQTNVTLAASTSNQIVYVGWNKNGADDVIIGLESTFSDASGDADQKIPLWTFNTDASGVTDVTDSRSFDQFSADSLEQGPGSGLDADTVDGLDASALSTDVSDSSSQVVADVSDINFDANLDVSDDGDGSVTVNIDDGPGSGLDADTVDGVEASALGSDVSNDGSTVTSSATDIDFTTNITASDDGDGTATVAINDGPGSGLDADTVDGVEASELGSDVSNDGSTVTSSSTDLNFTTGITASDDGDGTSTIELTADHSDLANIGSDDHHAKYTDAEAVSAVNAETTLTVDISGDADTLDGEDADAFLAVSGDTMVSQHRHNRQMLRRRHMLIQLQRDLTSRTLFVCARVIRGISICRRAQIRTPSIPLHLMMVIVFFLSSRQTQQKTVSMKRWTQMTPRRGFDQQTQTMTRMSIAACSRLLSRGLSAEMLALFSSRQIRSHSVRPNWISHDSAGSRISQPGPV